MKVKLFVLLLVASNCYSSCAAALRRTPKVYNALITTDENLTSSRAYPVIQPTIHETGLAHYPFGPYHANAFGLYSPLVRFGQPIAPGLVPRQQLPYPLPPVQFPPQYVPQPPPNAQPLPTETKAAPAPGSEPALAVPTTVTPIEAQPGAPPTAAAATLPTNEQLPLNELGLPPALIPVPQYPSPYPQPNRRPISPINLPPYGFNQYPLIYDPVTGYREQYLPPYDYYPNPNMFAVARHPNRGYPQGLPPTSTGPVSPPAPPQIPEPPAAAPTEVKMDTPTDALSIEPEVEEAPSFESIKNGSKSTDSDVPDVPPPPIPSGAKSKET